MRSVFIELNPFHGETLFTLCQNFCHRDDVVFGHQRLFGQALVSEISATKRVAAFASILRTLLRHDVQRCYFNTLNATLTPLTSETVGVAVRTLLLAVAARMFGKQLSAIIHDADQFYCTGLDSDRRATWFRRTIGWWLIRLFDERYVLTPEVQSFLAQRQIDTTVMDASAWQRFGSPIIAHRRQATVAWVGPVEGFRRNWRALLDLNADAFATSGLRIIMICDGSTADAPELRQELTRRGITNFFEFFDHRPDDYELVDAVRCSSAILCLYGSRAYGQTKSSGARILSYGLQKIFISTTPRIGVYSPAGELLHECDSLNACLIEIGNLTTTLQNK
jgi:hypothetical protein